MEFIQILESEKNICKSSAGKTRVNSDKYNYANKLYKKPWGNEYLAYQNTEIGIWVLKVNKGMETSVHCHFKKDTLLICLSGSFKINLYDSFRILNPIECLYIPREVFHGIHAYGDNCVLMEIELYTDTIKYTDKNDLLRLRDVFNRDKNRYETSITEEDDENCKNMNFHEEYKYVITHTEVYIMKLNNINNDERYKLRNSKIFLLEGIIYNDNKRITAGSIIDVNKSISLITGEIKIMSLYNIHEKYLNKLIYSKDHLKDYLTLNSLKNIGLTSGCFDILHEGHLVNLKKSKSNCDNLIVCLSSDDQIKRIKGETRPINKLTDRITMLSYYDFIDNIVLYDEIDDDSEIELDNIINIINPSIWFKGADYEKESIIKKHPNITNIMLFEMIDNKSTTDIIEKILKNNIYKE
jgi:rfaE bifunctional protein nucleotidyltransferase chain/domain